MSLLSDMVHGEVPNLPNEVHNVAEPDTLEYDKTMLSAEVQRRKAAMIKGALRPLLFYSEEEQIISDDGHEINDTSSTVENRLLQREEKPLG